MAVFSSIVHQVAETREGTVVNGPEESIRLRLRCFRFRKYKNLLYLTGRRSFLTLRGWIQKTAGNTFSWERYSADGELVQSYWVKECCLQRESLELDAAIWTLCEKHSEQYSIVLRDTDDTALVLSGHELNRLRSNGQLTLYPANYRLVYSGDGQLNSDQEGAD